MALVTDLEVIAITGEGLSTDCELQISVADTIVTENLSGQGLTPATLKNIELYLAAHFVLLTVENGPLAKKALGEGVEGYHNVYGPGLMSTRFGQMAILLDTTGILAGQAQAAAKPKLTALFTVVGTPPMSTY